MREPTLEDEVLQLAIKARRALKTRMPEERETAVYDLLKSAQTFAKSTSCKYEPFITAMVHTYNDERSEVYGQRRLFDGPSS